MRGCRGRAKDEAKRMYSSDHPCGGVRLSTRGVSPRRARLERRRRRSRLRHICMELPFILPRDRTTRLAWLNGALEIMDRVRIMTRDRNMREFNDLYRAVRDERQRTLDGHLHDSDGAHGACDGCGG